MTAPALTRNELTLIYGHLTRLDPLHMRPLTPAEVLEAHALREKVKLVIEGGGGALERGRKVFEWRVLQKDARTQNEIDGLAFGNPFAIPSIKKKLDRQVLALLDSNLWPDGRVHGDKTQRWVRATRFTSATTAIDDPTACDSLGAKMPIDALKRCGVIVDDKPEFCRRDGGVRKTKPGNVHVFIEVFEMAEDEVPDPGPQDAPVDNKKKSRGPIAQSIVDAGGPAAPKKRRARSPLTQSIVDTTGAPIVGPEKDPF